MKPSPSKPTHLLKNLLDHYLRRLNLILIFFTLFFIIFSFILYHLLNQEARQALLHQTSNRQLTISQAAANSITNFLRLSSNSVTLLARNPDLTSSTQPTLDNFVTDWHQTPVVGIFLTDNSGITTHSASRDGFNATPPYPISTTDYFSWATTASPGSTLLGQPTLATQPGHRHQHLIPLATPIYRDNQFSGVLVATILLSDLTENYLQPLQISPDTQIYLLDSQGLFLHAPQSHLIGTNVFSQLEAHPFLGSHIFSDLIHSTLAQPETGTLDIAYPKEPDQLPERMLVAYSPIHLNQSTWILAVSTPANAALTLIAPFYINQIALIIIGFLTLLVIAVMIAKHLAYHQCLSDYHRLHRHLL